MWKTSGNVFLRHPGEWVFHNLPRLHSIISGCLPIPFRKFLHHVTISNSTHVQHLKWSSPPNIRLDEDALKMSWRRLSFSSSENVLKTSSRRLDQDEYVHLGLTSSEDIFKTSSRRVGQDQYIRLGHASSRRFQEVFKTSSRHLQDVFKTFWRRLQNLFKTPSRRLAKMSSRRLENFFKTSCKDNFKTFSRRVIELNCSC